MLAGRYVTQNNTPRTADARFSFIININLSINGAQNNKPCRTRAFLVIDVRSRTFESIYPFGDRSESEVSIRFKRPHYHSIHIRRNIRSKRCKRLRLIHDLLHYQLHQFAGERRAAAQHQIRDRAKCIKVGAFVDTDLGLHLFGSHELGRSDDPA